MDYRNQHTVHVCNKAMNKTLCYGFLKEKIKRIKLEVQLESNSQPLGWKSDVLTTAPPV